MLGVKIVGTSGCDKPDGILDDIVRHGHTTNDLLEGYDLISRQHLADLGCLVDCGLTNNLHFFLERRVVEADVEHETVELCFGKRIGTLLLDRILCGQNKEWVRQRV